MSRESNALSLNQMVKVPIAGQQGINTVDNNSLQDIINCLEPYGQMGKIPLFEEIINNHDNIPLLKQHKQTLNEYKTLIEQLLKSNIMVLDKKNTWFTTHQIKSSHLLAKIYILIDYIDLSENLNSKNLTSLTDLRMLISKIENRKITAEKYIAQHIEAITLGLRAGSDDINPLLGLGGQPNEVNGLIVGSIAATIDIFGSFFYLQSPKINDMQDHLDKLILLKYAKLFKQKLMIKDNISSPWSKLDRRIKKILAKHRGYGPDSLFMKTDSLEKYHNLVDPVTNKNETVTTENETENSFDTALIDLEDRLLDFANGEDNIKKILTHLKSIFEQIDQLDNNRQQTLQIQLLWQCLNNKIYWRKARMNNYLYLRSGYETPLGEILKDPGYIDEKILNRLVQFDPKSDLSKINSSDPTSSLSTANNDELYKKLRDLLEDATKENCIEIMYYIHLTIRSNNKLDDSKKAILFNKLYNFRLHRDHGSLHKVANSNRQYSYIKKAIISFIRYGLHNIPTINMITENTIGNSTIRWGLFGSPKAFGASSFYSEVIERSHTRNTVGEIYCMSLIEFCTKAEIEQNYQTSSSTTVEPQKIYYKFPDDLDLTQGNLTLSNAKLNGVTVPQVFFKIFTSCNNQDNSTNEYDASSIQDKIAQFYTDYNHYNNENNYNNELHQIIKGSECCSIIKFDKIIKIMFGIEKDKDGNRFKLHPLVAMLLLFGHINNDEDPKRKIEKTQILLLMINTISSDSSSVLYQAINPSILKVFALEMGISIAFHSLYGTLYAVSHGFILIPLLVLNYLRIGITDSESINQLSRKIFSTNRGIILTELSQTAPNFEKDKNDDLEQINKLYQYLINSQTPYYLRNINNTLDVIKLPGTIIKNEAKELITKLNKEFFKEKATSSLNISYENPVSNNDSELIIDKDKYVIDPINFLLILIREIDLNTSSSKTMLARKIVVLISLLQQFDFKALLANDDSGDSNVLNTSNYKIYTICLLIILLKMEVIVPELNQRQKKLSDAFTDPRIIIQAITTLGPKSALELPLTNVTECLIGMGVDIAGGIFANAITAPSGRTKEFHQVIKSLKEIVLQEIESQGGETNVAQRSPELDNIIKAALSVNTGPCGIFEMTTESLREYTNQDEPVTYHESDFC